MKNSFKTGLLALTIAVAAVACKGKSSTDGADTTTKDSLTKTVTDTTHKDTSSMPDGLKKDTTIKTTTTVKSEKVSVKPKPKN